MAILATPVTAESVGDLSTLIDSWRRSLKAANKTDKTIATYMEAARQLLAFLAESGMPTLVLNIRREHVEAFVGRLVDTRSACDGQQPLPSPCGPLQVAGGGWRDPRLAYGADEAADRARGPGAGPRGRRGQTTPGGVQGQGLRQRPRRGSPTPLHRHRHAAEADRGQALKVRARQRRARHYGRVARPPTRSTVAEAARALRNLLAAIDAGEIDADDPKARALRRQLEGAAAAGEEASGGGAASPKPERRSTS